MKRLLVTGANGNVGREVVRACAGEVVVRASHRAGQAPSTGGAHEGVPFDFLQRATWRPALEGCEYVFLMRPPPLGNMAQTLIPFIDAAYEAGAQHIVFLSVAGADRMKWVPHRKVELHLEKTGAAWTVLRPGFFAQNLQDAYRQDILEDGRLYVPAANGRVAFIDVRDAAQVVARVLREPSQFRGEFLTLTGPEAVGFADVASALSRALGRPINYTPASVLGYGWHLYRARRLPLMQIVVQTILHLGLRRGDAERVDSTLERLLGRPGRRVSEYIADNAATWQSSQHE